MEENIIKILEDIEKDRIIVELTRKEYDFLERGLDTKTKVIYNNKSSNIS